MIEAQFPGAALASAAFLFLAAGCATTQQRQEVEASSRARGFEPVALAGTFNLFALARKSAQAETLSIYIEGDGAPWGPHHPPRDPTPRDPVALALASADPSRAVAWLSRPCQYLDASALAGCDAAYWTNRRFAPEVVAAYDAAVTRLKAHANAQRVRLVGYSGGGVIAALVAARRADIDRLITVAAPLSVADWVRWHDLTPLAGSLDPQREPGNPPAPGVHFAGSNDKTVPVAIIAGYVRSKGGRLETVAGFDHECCWARDWPQLLEHTR